MSETGEKQNSGPSEAEPAPAPTTTETKVEAPASLTLEALKFPEGIEVDQELATGLVGVLNDPKLEPAARAQALVDMHLKAVEAASEKASKFYEDLQTEWVESALKEFGGEEKLRPMLGDIAKLIDKYGGTTEQQSELRDLFALTGAGNSPRMVGFLYNIAKELSAEGRPLTDGRPSSQGRTAAEILYPSMAKG